MILPRVPSRKRSNDFNKIKLKVKIVFKGLFGAASRIRTYY